MTAPTVDAVSAARVQDGRLKAPATRPLAGFTVTYTAGGTAVDVAVRHLKALGARPVRTASSGADGSRLVLTPPGTGDAARPLVCELTDLAHEPASRATETVIQAMTGIMAVHGRKSGGPRRLPLEYAAACTGVLAVQGMLAALVARCRGKDVHTVRTAASSAALLAMSQYLAADTALEEQGLPEGGQHTGPPFRSRDEVWFELEALDGAPWREFWAALGIRGQAAARGWHAFAGRYATAVSRLPAELHLALGRYDFARITALGRATGVSVCAVRGLEERRVDFRAGADGVRIPPPWALRAMPTAPRQSVRQAEPAPPGTPDVTDLHGHDDVTSPQLPLRGLTVVEATRRIQGPMAGRILQLLGARVIRVEPPGGDPQRGMPPTVGDYSARFLALNNGKEVVEADLKTATGIQTVRNLASTADVFLHNWAPGKAEEFGLSADRLCQDNPGLVYAHASGWGPTNGPDTHLGTDFMVQAHSGLAWQMAGDTQQPQPSLMTVLDVLGGLVSAEGILAGLLDKELHQRAQVVDSSLLSACSVLQYEALERPRTARMRRPSPLLEGPYSTSTGSVVIALPSMAALRALCRFLTVDPLLPEAELRDRISALLRARPAAEWVAGLRALGFVSAVVLEDLADVADDVSLASATHKDGCLYVHAPWRFGS